MKPIQRIEISGYGPFDGAVFEIPRAAQESKLVIFEGPNGSGKTTLLEAIACALDAPTTGPNQGQSGLPDPHNNRMLASPGDRFAGKARETDLHIELICADNTKLSVPLMMRSKSSVGSRGPFFGADPQSASLEAFRGGQGKGSGPLRWAAFAYGGAGKSVRLSAQGPGQVKLHPLQGALAFSDNDDTSIATELGTYLMVLDYERARIELKKRDEADAERRLELEARANALGRSIAQFSEALTALLGYEVDVDFPLSRQSPRVLFDGEEIPIEFLGDGLRRTFSWVVDLLIRLQRIDWHDKTRSPNEQCFWLLLDEVDESLHPSMQVRLLPAVRRLFPNAQLYVASHSPFVVASVGEGAAFSIRPDNRTHLVDKDGVSCTELTPGRSIEWVAEEIFHTSATFVDEETKLRLSRHEAAIQALRARQEIDWQAFRQDRAWLLGLGAEISTIVRFKEAPVHQRIEAWLADQG